MAVFASVLHPAPENKNGTIGAGVSSAEISIGNNRIFVFNADQDVMIKFGNTGMGAAAATDFRIIANTYAPFDMGQQVGFIRLFNNGGSTANWFIQYLSKV